MLLGKFKASLPAVVLLLLPPACAPGSVGVGLGASPEPLGPGCLEAPPPRFLPPTRRPGPMGEEREAHPCESHTRTDSRWRCGSAAPRAALAPSKATGEQDHLHLLRSSHGAGTPPWIHFSLTI